MNGTCGIEAQPRWGWVGWRILTQGSPDLRRDNPGLEDMAPLGPPQGCVRDRSRDFRCDCPAHLHHQVTLVLTNMILNGGRTSLEATA